MGREALCRCEWASMKADVKALLEGRDLIVRGAIRRRVPIAHLKNVCADGERLTFQVGKEKIALHLGAEAASRWAKAITATPRSLAQKLGIQAGTDVKFIGKMDDENLETALAVASDAGGGKKKLIVARVDSHDELQGVFERIREEVEAGIPLWVVYPKGKERAFGEASVRETLRQDGLMDTKVASVSTGLTALRFSWHGTPK